MTVTERSSVGHSKWYRDPAGRGKSPPGVDPRPALFFMQIKKQEETLTYRVVFYGTKILAFAVTWAAFVAFTVWILRILGVVQ